MKTEVRALEERLRRLAAEAAEAGSYEETMRIAAVAQRVGVLLAATEPGGAGGSAVSPGTMAGNAGTRGRAGINGRVRTPRKDRKTRPARSSRPAGYPRFERRGEELVKVAWSKREQKEYEHRAPKSVVDMVAESLCAVCTGDTVTPTADILADIESRGAELPPVYQIYVVLAWLRSLGLVEVVGRQGYRNAGISRERVEEAWESL